MKFEGEVGEIELISRLVELGREKFTGALRFENDAIIKIIYFKEGDILSASTNDRTDSIDEILLKAAKVTREHLKQALSKRKESETLGDALLNLGFITRKELTWARRVQVIGIIRSIQQWTTGSYTLVADYLPKREEGTIFNLAQIILELLLTETDRARLNPTIASGEAVFKRTANFDKFYPELGLNQEADTILTTVDGERNASEVVEASSSDAFNVYKLLQALEYLGLIEREKPQVIPELSGHTEQFEWNEPLPPLSSSSEPAATLAVPLYQPQPAPAFELDEDQPLTKTLTVSEHDYISEAAIVPPEPGARPKHVKPPMFGQVARKKRSSLPLVALIVVLCGGAAYGAYWYLHRDSGQATQVAAAPVRNPQPRPVPPPTGTSSTVGTNAAMGTTTSATLVSSVPTGTVGSLPTLTASPTTTSTVAVTSTQPQKPTSTVSQPVSRPTPPPAQTAAVVTTAAPVKPAPVKPPAPAQTSKPISQPPPVTPSRPSPPPVTMATSPGSSELKQKYDALARSYENQMSSTAFTLQVELVCRPESVTKAIGAGGSNVWFVPISYKGGSCYRVFWGRYATRADAERASGQIPAILRESKPVVVSVQALRGN